MKPKSERGHDEIIKGLKMQIKIEQERADERIEGDFMAEDEYKQKLAKEQQNLFKKYGNKPLAEIPTKDLIRMLELRVCELGNYDFLSVLSAKAVFDEIRKRCLNEKSGKV